MPEPHRSVFTGRMPFLPPKQQRQSTEGIQFSNVMLRKTWIYQAHPRRLAKASDVLHTLVL